MKTFMQYLQEASALDYPDIEQASDEFFSRRKANQNIGFEQILTALGLPPTIEPKVIGKGSTATVYQHPDPNKVIKVTGDMEDARNLRKAQRLRNPNILKVHNIVKVGRRAIAIEADKINGTVMPYGSDTIAALIQGDDFEDAEDAADSIHNPTGIRLEILTRMGKNNQAELDKLSDLFRAIAQLERIGIDMYDFTDNVIDNGTHYVIVDMGQ